MELKNLFTDDRAVSPVVGVALLIAIAVILAVVIGAVVLNLGPGGANAPSVDAAADYDETNASITITHRGGDPLNTDEIVLRDESGNTEPLTDQADSSLSDGKLTAGESFQVVGSELNGLNSNETVTVVWEAPNGDKTIVVDTFEP